MRVRKRTFDVVVGLVLLVVAVPLIALLALGVAVTLRTWKVFFVQRRVGIQGRHFRMLKLRTMPCDAPRYATKDAFRVALPRYCAFLRATHLDELPQLGAVITGRLSLVGPRPRMPDAYEPVDVAYRELREQVPQGCTGLWQISPHNTEMPHAHPEYDALYVSRWTLRLDIWILAMTVLGFIGVARPCGLANVPRVLLRGRHELPERYAHDDFDYRAAV